MSLKKAGHPFQFFTQSSLVYLTDDKASDLKELRECLSRVSENVIYYHTHHFLQQHQFLVPEPPNDFAYWIGNAVQDDVLAERVAAIDTVRFNSLAQLRQALIETLDSGADPSNPPRRCPPGHEFHFRACRLFHLPAGCAAEDLAQFREGFARVSISSLYFHIFEARLRAPVGKNDFSLWLESELEEKDLADAIDRLDPYTHTMEGLRKRILVKLDKRLHELNAALPS